MHRNDTYLSVVIPVYGCSQCLHELYSRLVEVLEKINTHFEIIMINDASPDDSIQTIKAIADADHRVRGIFLSRNFGQHYAITAGLDHSHGEWIVVMDCDLQDQPEEILKLYNEAQKGYDVVVGRRQNRQDSFFKKLGSTLFYKVFSYLTDTKQDSTTANFGVYHRKTIDALNLMRENLRFFPILIKWVGFRSTTIEIIHNERQSGKSSYSLKKLVNLAIDVMLAYSDKPLKLTVRLGLMLSFTSFVFALLIFIRAILGIQSIQGWYSIIVSIWFFSGMIIFILGIIGSYIGKIFDEVKRRPLYIVGEYYQKKLDHHRGE